MDLFIPGEYSFRQAMAVIEKLASIPELKGKIFVAGGLVPWLVTKTDSQRSHHDVDFIVRKEDREYVKDILVLNNAKIKRESLVTGDVNNDHGFEMALDVITTNEQTGEGLRADVRIDFYPFTIDKDNAIELDIPDIKDNQYPNADQLNFKKIKITGVKKEDFLITTTLFNGGTIGIVSPEICFLIKSGFYEGKNNLPILNDKDKKDVNQLLMCTNMEKVQDIQDEANKIREMQDVASEGGTIGGPSGSQAEETNGMTMAKGRRAPRGTGAYADALILAFITGMVGGLFLFILLKAIQ